MTAKAIIHTPVEIEGIRKAAAATAKVRDQLAAAIRPGMSTAEVDQLAESFIKDSGGQSAFLNYHGYPGQICISVNDVVVHGIGSPAVVLKDGDIVSVDIGVRLGGFVGDTAKTVPVGGACRDKDIERLLLRTEESLYAGIAAAKPGNFIRDISAAVERVAKAAKLGIVREYVGHGCGRDLHEPPEIPNFSSAHRGPELRPGMVLAIEPMLNLGGHKVNTDKDGWTVRTSDGTLSAHFEHMVLVTDKEPEILTWQKT